MNFHKYCFLAMAAVCRPKFALVDVSEQLRVIAVKASIIQLLAAFCTVNNRKWLCLRVIALKWRILRLLSVECSVLRLFP